MFFSPYDTAIASQHVMDRVVRQVEMAKATGDLIANALPDVPQLFIVAGKNPAMSVIPPFSHPLTIGSGTNRYTVIDLRPYNAQILFGEHVRLPKDGQVGLLVKQALLQIIWQSGRHSDLSAFSDLPLGIFASWVSEGISRRVGLDANTLMSLTALTGWYYQCLFMPAPSGELDDRVKMTHATKISRTLGIKLDLVSELINTHGFIDNSTSYINAAKQLGSTRLNELSTALFFTILAGSWFGSASARETVAVALEYPPTFIAMVHTAINEKMYRKSPITETSVRFNRRNAFPQFNLSFSAMVSSAGE